MDEINYCLKWNFRKKCPGIPLTEEEARARHFAGDEYMAVLPLRPGTLSPVLVTVVRGNKFVGVTFLDDFGRRHIDYSFAEKNEDRLFLDDVFIWIYPNDNPRLRVNDAVAYEQISFREDGYASRVAVNKAEQIKDTTDYIGVPIDDNWEPIPEFGKYQSVSRFERKLGPAAYDIE